MELRGTWLAHAGLDLRAMNLSPALGVEFTYLLT